MRDVKIMIEEAAKKLRENPDFKKFYMGTEALDTIKSYKNVNAYKWRKRWL